LNKLTEPFVAPKAVVSLEKDEIFIRSGCRHKEILATTQVKGKPSALNVDGAIFIDAGKGRCKYCPKEMPEMDFPEVQVRIF